MSSMGAVALFYIIFIPEPSLKEHPSIWNFQSQDIEEREVGTPHDGS